MSLSGAGDYTFLFSSFFSLDPSDIDGIQIALFGGVSASSTVRFESIVIGSAPCPAGQYDNGSGCVNAEPGYYVPVSGATEQTPCALGTYQPNAGSVSCILAEAGHFVAVTGAASQIECALGAYQPNSGSISCILAEPGHYVNIPAAIEQIACQPGSYQPNANAILCDLADPGYFVDSYGAVAQTACPAGYTSDAGAAACTLANVVYNFSGFFSPIDSAPTLNVAKAGQTIPLKWRITDANGAPVTNLSGVTVSVSSLTCDLGATADGIEEYASGSSGLQNLGDGYYQFNWKTPKSYANSCKTLKLNLGEGAGFEHTALFKFTK